MDYQEKLRLAKEALDSGSYDKGTIEYIFPELKESEDERIRKGIIRNLEYLMDRAEGFVKEELQQRIAWLEKQGKQKPIISDDAIMEGVAHFGITQYQITNWLKKYVDVKKQGEQKPTDNVEPKFKVGDWVVTPDNEVKQIEKVGFGNYYFTDNTLYNIIDTDNEGHLWTIQDAKDGDIIVTPSDNIFIFKEIQNNCHIYDHCGIYYDNFFVDSDCVNGNCAVKLPDDYELATKEQRALLFSKMKESGYEWDAEKKELRKIEQNSKEKTKFYDSMDDLIADALIEEIENSDLDDSSKHNRIFWIKSHRQKPAWSEEDEEMFDDIIADIQFTQKAHTHDDNQVVYEREIDWLKSIKERMKGE